MPDQSFHQHDERHASMNKPNLLAPLSIMVLALVTIIPARSNAQETAATRSAEEIAAELANPNTVLGTMNFNFDATWYDGDLPGAGDQSGTSLSFQPVLPYPIKSGVNFFLRPLIPLVFSRPVPSTDGFDDVGMDLGDITMDSAVGVTMDTGLVLVGGLVMSMPTATDDRISLDQWLLGPEGLVAFVKPWGALGLLVTQSWDIAGEDSYSTSLMAGQYFVVFNLGSGWQLRSSPPFSYNHKAASGQRWSFPIGGGVNRTAILGNTPWKFGIEYWKYVVAPDAFGADSQIRITVAPVVPLPWGG